MRTPDGNTSETATRRTLVHFAVDTEAVSMTTRLAGTALLEKLFINLFDMQRVFDPASYIVADHQAC